MFALDLFNTDHERRLAEGAVDQLEQRRIDDLTMKMDYCAKHGMTKEFMKAKEERDSYFKVKEPTPSGIYKKNEFDIVEPQDECMGYGSLVGEEDQNTLDEDDDLAMKELGAGYGVYQELLNSWNEKKPFAKIPMPGGEFLTISRPHIFNVLYALKNMNDNAFKKTVANAFSSLDKFMIWSNSIKRYNLPKEKPQAPQGAPGQMALFKETSQKKNSNKTDDVSANDTTVQRELQRIRARHPAAHSDLEALAKDEIGHQAQTDKTVSDLEAVNAQQDAALKKSMSLDQQQDREIDNIENQVNRLAQRLQAVKSGKPSTVAASPTVSTATAQDTDPANTSGAQSVTVSDPESLSQKDQEIYSKIKDLETELKTKMAAMATWKKVAQQDDESRNELEALRTDLNRTRKELNRKIKTLRKDAPNVQTAPQAQSGLDLGTPNSRNYVSNLRSQLGQIGDPDGEEGLNILSQADLDQMGNLERQPAPVEEGAMGELDIERQDLEQMSERQFYKAHNMSKAAFQQKYRALLKPALDEGQRLHRGDPIVVTAPNEFEGKTGEIYDFSPSGTFVIVNLYNHGKHSMHLSDVEYNEYADDQEQDDWYDEGVAEGYQDFNKVEPYAVCLAGKPVKKFDYYEEARRFHDNWKQKLYREGDKAKADKITLMPLNLDEDTGSWIVYDPETKQIRKRFKTHTAGKSYARTHGLGFASSEYYFDRVKDNKEVAENDDWDDGEWTDDPSQHVVVKSQQPTRYPESVLRAIQQNPAMRTDIIRDYKRKQQQGMSEGRPEDLPGIDYDRPGDTPRKRSGSEHNPYPYSPEEDDDYFREIFRRKREAAAKAQGNALKEFAPGQGGGSGNYFQALASAWYNGTFNTGSLGKGIKSQQDVERLLQRGILCPDGVTRKFGIDYNSDFDGVVISSDDYYEHADYNDQGQEVDSRTGQKWGPYDYMEFGDEQLDEGWKDNALVKAGGAITGAGIGGAIGGPSGAVVGGLLGGLLDVARHLESKVQTAIKDQVAHDDRRAEDIQKQIDYIKSNYDKFYKYLNHKVNKQLKPYIDQLEELHDIPKNMLSTNQERKIFALEKYLEQNKLPPASVEAMYYQLMLHQLAYPPVDDILVDTLISYSNNPDNQKQILRNLNLAGMFNQVNNIKSQGVAEGLVDALKGSWEKVKNFDSPARSTSNTQRYQDLRKQQELKRKQIKNQVPVNELSTDKLAQYKTAAALDASAADKRGDYERGDKRFAGIIKATKKQFANDIKKHKPVAEEFEPSPVASAIVRRIMFQHPELLKQYGPNLVNAAVDNVADYVGDVDEIGTSDVSAWVAQVERMLKDNPPDAFAEAQTDYQKRRQRERDVDAGKPVARQPRNPQTDYARKRAKDKRDMELGEESSTSSDAVERAILNRIMVAHTDLLMKFGPDKVMQAAEEVAYNVGDVDEIGTSDVSAYVNQVQQILGA